jgi:hypothetical protein
MADVTTIWVAVTGALATVVSGLGGSLGGYRFAARNEEARDNRAADREAASRAAALAERLQEQRHERQRKVLLDLQDALQQMARSTGKILNQDLATVRDKGGLFLLPEGLGGDETLAATVAVQKLAARVLDSELRSIIRDFVSFCSYATTGYIPGHKNDPPDELADLIRDLTDQMGSRYATLADRLGEHIRREEDRQ